MDRTCLITGAAGTLGTWILRTRPGNTPVVAASHSRSIDGVPSARADLRDRTAVERVLGQIRPSMVIHAAYANDHRSIVDATRNVAECAESVSATLLFISTDAVFAGDGEPRAEDSEPDPVSDYGRWKLEAERCVMSASPTNAVVRLPLIISLQPADSGTARIRESAVGEDSTVWFRDEFRQPARAEELAEAIWDIAALQAHERAGIWHLPGPERLSRFDIAVRVAEALGLPPGRVSPGDTPAELQRPRDLLFTGARAERILGWSPASIPGATL